MNLIVLLLSSNLALADCAATIQQVQLNAEAVLAAYVAMDEPSYELASRELHETVECVTEPLTGDALRDLHLVMALDRFLMGDEDGALGGLRAVLDIAPDYQLSTDLAPTGHPLRELIDRARALAPNPRASFLRPIEGVFWLDGQAMAGRAAGQPVLVQWADIEREICWTGYLADGVGVPASIVTAATEPGELQRCLAERRLWVAEAPPEPTASPEPAASAQATGQSSAPLPPIPVLPDAPTLIPTTEETAIPAPTVERSVLLRPLPLATAGGLVVSASLFGATLVARHRLLTETEACAVERACNLDPEAALERLDELEQRTRRLGYAMQISTGVTLGLGAAAGITLAF